MKLKVGWKPWVIGTAVTVGGAALGAGISLGVVLPKALEAKEGLKAFISEGGAYKSLRNVDKINYVALGDSATAGANGTLRAYDSILDTVDPNYKSHSPGVGYASYRSYSDFLAKSLDKADRLGNYSNFAISGGRLADVKKDLFEIPRSAGVLKDANLITLTLGANDILAVLNMLNIAPFYYFQSIVGNMNKAAAEYKKMGGDSASESEKQAFIAKYPFMQDIGGLNTILNNTTTGAGTDYLSSEAFLNSINFAQTGRDYDQDPHGIDKPSYWTGRDDLFDDSIKTATTKEDAVERFSDTAYQITQLLGGNPEPYINLDKDWNEKIFQIVEREMATLVHDLTEAAPNADIIFLGYAFPFEQFPDEIQNVAKPAIQEALGGNKDWSLKQAYEHLLDGMKSGIKKSLGSNDYVSFLDANEMEPVKNGKGLIDYSSSEKFKNSYKKKVMPNITDIHPSVYGYDMIGQGLFEFIGKDLGLTEAEIEANTVHSTEYVELSNDTDLNDDDASDTKDQILNFANQGNLARLDEASFLLDAQYEAQKSFYDILNAPTALKSPSAAFPAPVTTVLNKLVTEVQKGITDGNAKAWTESEIVATLPAGVKFPIKDDIEDAMPLIKAALAAGQDKEHADALASMIAESTKDWDDADKAMVKQLTGAFTLLGSTLATWTADIAGAQSYLATEIDKDANNKLVTTNDKLNSKETLIYSENAAIRMFLDYSTILQTLSAIEEGFSAALTPKAPETSE